MIARNYDPEIGRFMGVDPHFMNYPNLSPYHYVMGNPLLYLDPNGRDTTLYLRQETANIDQNSLNEAAKTIENIFNSFGIQMAVTVLNLDENGNPQFIIPDDTDVVIGVADDNHPVIRRTKGESPDAEGTSKVGSGQGIVTANVKERKGVNNQGLGLLILHEAGHAVGLQHPFFDLGNTFMTSHQSSTKLNSGKTKINNKQKKGFENYLKPE